MYGGDEVNAIVIDVGTHAVKAGYAGEESPKVYYPSCVGALTRDKTETRDTNGKSGQNGAQAGGRDVEMAEAGADASTTPKKEGEASKAGNKSDRDLFVGHFALNYRRDGMEVLSPFEQKTGLLNDWEIVENIWNYTLKDRLQIDPKEHPVLLAEPNFNTNECREKSLEILFETFQPPAVFLSKNACLSSYSAGRPTSLVIDMGHQSSVAAAVHDGYLLQKSVSRSRIGGDLLTECMHRSVQSKDIKVRPRYAFERTESKQNKGTFDVKELDDYKGSTTETYHKWSVEQILSDLKETVCRVSESVFNEEEHANIPTVTYELPDGTEVQIGSDRFKVPEVLFNPGLVQTFQDAQTIENMGVLPLQSMTSLVMESITKVDVDVRKELYNGIILAGGSSMLPNVRERLEREILEQAPGQARVKVIASQNVMERKFGVWIGGSILASLGSFQQCWMSKQEYEEKGASLIHLKAP
ncbi:actin [Chloropicon primus]|uniref:Actin n=1 Tax=Chloropicon primus TaxID=1764295 RepID=A0A5B8MZ76_9CHLO|nr:actin [Chloropicon primus]UPR04194.1 actin [Chloropicon primus]|mmetsp:Transcript_409/g.1164  ORF Transcript_409/g.1164 Transcript_409/m.1164 type:complete len:470 (+) Transcript_409:491-1900(+)|eukprot:QDZ24985.1 actin [Chloropicon primus]